MKGENSRMYLRKTEATKYAPSYNQLRDDAFLRIDSFTISVIDLKSLPESMLDAQNISFSFLHKLPVNKLIKN